MAEYYLQKNRMMEVTTKDSLPGSIVYHPIRLRQQDFIYKSEDFEPPIGKREWIAWILLLVSIVANVVTALFA